MKPSNILVNKLLVLLLLTGLLGSIQISSAFARFKSEVDTIAVDPEDLQLQIYLPIVILSEEVNWPMAGANPQRTSWVSKGVDPSNYNQYGVEWYRPIEAYIGQHVQLVAARDKIYVSSARGVYALNAENGDLEWRFDTELPVGHSPTVSKDMIFIGGFDRRVYALNADSGSIIWSFMGAKAGYSTNPLVVDDTVLIGNRDGYFYALDRATGSLLWQFPTSSEQPLAPIMYSAAYKEGKVFFAANDNYAYALNILDGKLIWRSGPMPGDGFQAYWPVVVGDHVIFSSALSYADQANPGIWSISDVVDPNDPYYDLVDPNTTGTDFTHHLQRNDIFYNNEPAGTLIGPAFIAGGASDKTGINWSWPLGEEVIDAARVTNYLEDDGQRLLNRPTNKPWRRTVNILNTSNGSEYQFDSDNDGFMEYAPFLYTGTKSGNRYPPIIIPTRNSIGARTEVIYDQTMVENWGIPGAKLVGWQLGTQYILPVGDQYAIDEPFANSAAGDVLYMNLCCDRIGKTLNMNTKSERLLWGYAGYTLESIKYSWDQIEYWMKSLAPGYDEMWWGASMYDYYPRVYGNYGTLNGIYHNHGLQSPIIPYKDRLYVHRSNAVIAYGPNPANIRQMTAGETPSEYEQNIKQEYPDVYRPLVEIGEPDQNSVSILTVADVSKELDSQVLQILNTGHLRPGYFNSTRGFYEMAGYYENPGDTLLVLLQAYPYVAESLQTDLEKYIKQHYQRYFADSLYAQTGYWIDNPGIYDLQNPFGYGQLQARDWMPLPPEIDTDIKAHPINYWPRCCWDWEYPQQNFYSIWLYADTFYKNDLTKIQEIYQNARFRLDTDPPNQDILLEKSWIHNGYITGYFGFLKLQQLAGMAQDDVVLRSMISAKLDELLQLRAENFQKDSPWAFDDLCCSPNLDKRALNIARNFLYLSPDLSTYLKDNALEKVRTAVGEYEYVAPYWFASRYEASFGEFASQNLYTNHALFMAKAYIMEDTAEQLLKFLDVPSFKVGDLFYIQNLVAILDRSS